MRILVKDANNAREVYPSLDPKMTFAAFRAMVSAKSKVDWADYGLFSGFPLKQIVVADDTEVQAVLKNGDTVVIKPLETEEPQSNVQGGAWEYLPSIPQKTGMMVRKECPQDNSCLFHAILLVCEEGKMTVTGLRELVANIVAADPQRYDSTFLGCPPYQYQQQIMNPDYWGGAIELSIASTHYQCEIVAFDYHHLREDVYGEDQNYKTRVFLIYTGNHYDAMAFQPASGKEVLKFSSQDLYAWERARHHAQFLHLESVRKGECTEVKTWRHDRRAGKSKSRTSSSCSTSSPSLGPVSSSSSSRSSASSQPSVSSSSSTSVSSSSTSTASSSSSSTSSQPPVTFHTGETDQDYWECSCTLRNPLPLTTCEACGLERGGQRSLAPWVCPSCTFSNEASRPTCEVCQQPGPHAGPPDPSERPPAPQSAPEALIEDYNPLADILRGAAISQQGAAGGGGARSQPSFASLMGQSDGWDCPRCRTHNISGVIQCKQCKLHHLTPGQEVCTVS